MALVRMTVLEENRWGGIVLKGDCITGPVPFTGDFSRNIEGAGADKSFRCDLTYDNQFRSTIFGHGHKKSCHEKSVCNYYRVTVLLTAVFLFFSCI